MVDPSELQFNPAINTGLRVQSSTNPAAGPAPSGEASFTQTLAKARGLEFSNHAQKRLQSREIQLDDERVNRLADAVDNVEKSGGKLSMVLVDDLAFIVNVRDRKVVTALDTKTQGRGVYNQIDSVAFAQQTSPSTIKKTA
jgi:flagellar operon protein